VAKSKPVIDLILGLEDGPDPNKASTEADYFLLRAESEDTHFKVIGWRWNTVAKQLVLRLEHHHEVQSTAAVPGRPSDNPNAAEDRNAGGIPPLAT
jgi:hypothetical protein